MPLRIPGVKQPWFPFAVGGAIVGALARGPSQTVSRPTANASRPGQEATAIARPPSSGSEFDVGRQLIHEYLRGIEPGVTTTGLSPTDTVEVLIATLPDPFDSHLDWIYDANLDAIRRAFVRANYLPDRFWIRERRDSVTLKAPTAATSDSVALKADARARSDSATAKAATKDSIRVAVRDAFPGVMLFRSADPKSRQLRLLYLVSELPTTGIYRNAFVAALKERAALARRDGKLSSDTLDDRSPIRIVGPTFSGSVPSLERAIASWIAESGHQHDTFAIISGSATDSAAVERMAAAPHVDFHTTIYPDYVANRFIRDSVIERFGFAKRGRVAILRETGTAYGRSFKDAPIDTGAAIDTIPIIIPFPLNIGSLRAEYEKHPEPAPQHPTSLRAPARIPLSLEDSARPKEEPPLRSSVTTATIDASVNEIVGTLRDLHVSAVGIVATDIRDKLFLADLLHHNLPDVPLFTFEANRLYLRPEYSAALRGMLVISTYPLVVQNQAWTDPQRHPDQLLAFPTDAAEGTYNAVLAQLSSALPLLDYRLPFDSADSLLHSPPIWISAVGGTSLVPLAALPVPKGVGPRSAPHLLRRQAAPDAPRQQTAISAKASTKSHDPEMPLGTPMPLVMVLWGVLSASIARILLGARRDLTNPVVVSGDSAVKRMELPPEPSRAEQEWYIEDRYQEIESISLELHRRLYAWLEVVALVALYFPFAATIYRTYSGRWAYIGVTSAVLLLLGIALTWGFLTLLRSLWNTGELGLRYLTLSLWRNRRGRQMRWVAEVVGRFAVALTGLTFLVLLSIFVADRMLLYPNSIGSQLFLFRSFRTGSGLSPITFIGLAGFGLVAWSEWHRRRIAALCKLTPVEQVTAQLRTGVGVANESDSKQMALWVRLADRIAEVRGRLFLLMPRNGSFFVGATLLVISFWLIPQFGPTFESIARPARVPGWSFVAARSFDRLLVGCIIGSLWLTAWTVYRFLAVWEALRRVLAEIGNTPLVAACERLPQSIARMLQPSLFDDDESDVIEEAVQTRVQELSGLAQHAPTLQLVAASQQMAQAATHRRRAANSEGVVMEMEALTVRTDPVPLHAEEDDQRSLAETLRGLSVVWEREPSDEGVRVPATGSTSPIPAAAPSDRGESNPRRLTDVGDDKNWLRLAEEVVAIRVVQYIASVLQEIKRITAFLLVSLIATSLLISSYWFQSEAMVTLVFMMILFGTVGSLVYVSLEMNREELLSRVSGTEPGKVNWSIGFVVNLTLIGVVPILLAVSSQFPAVRSALFAWVEPVLKEILHG